MGIRGATRQRITSPGESPLRHPPLVGVDVGGADAPEEHDHERFVQLDMNDTDTGSKSKDVRPVARGPSLQRLALLFVALVLVALLVVKTASSTAVLVPVANSGNSVVGVDQGGSEPGARAAELADPPPRHVVVRHTWPQHHDEPATSHGQPLCNTLPQFACERRGCGAAENPCVWTNCSCPAPQCTIEPESGECVVSPAWVSDVDGTAAAVAQHAAVDGLPHRSRPFTRDGECFDDAMPQHGRPVVTPSPAPLSRAATDALHRINSSARWLFPDDRTSGASLPSIIDTTLGCDGDSELSSQNVPRYSLMVDESSRLTRMEGVCIRASGPPIAIAPSDPVDFSVLPAFAQETGFVFPDAMDDITAWVKHVELVPFSDARMRHWCWLSASMPAIVMPVTVKADNEMHVLHRIVSVIRYLRDTYGENYEDSLFVVYVVTAQGAVDLGKSNAHALLRRMLSRNWISVYARSTTHAPATADGGTNATAASSGEEPLLCLPNLHLVPSMERKLRGDRYAFVPTRYSFTWNGERSPADTADIRDFRRRFLECALGKEAAAPRVGRRSHRLTSPKVTIVWRSRSRRFLGFNTIAWELQEFAKHAGFGSLAIVEHTKLNPETLASIYSDTDVLIGAVGGGLLWSLLMPPGTVIFELVRDFGCAVGHGGWFQASRCDYGGNAEAARQLHYTLQIPAFVSMRQQSPVTNVTGRSYLPLDIWKGILKAAMCRLEKGKTNDWPDLNCMVDRDFSPSWNREALADT